MSVSMQRTALPARATALLVAIFMLVALAPVIPVQATVGTWYVDVATGDDANPGTEAEPFKSITAGLAAASEGDTVMVAPGVYSAGEDEEPNGGMQPLEASGEVFPLEVPADATLVSSGGSAVTVIDGEYRGGQPLILVVESDGATVEGFTVTRGAFEVGGGAHVADSEDVVFRDVSFEQNIAYAGGGIFASFSSVTLDDCVFVGGVGEYENGNEVGLQGMNGFPTENAFYGGGLFGYGVEIQLHECDFEDNIAIAVGAGAYFDGSDVEVHGGHVSGGYVTGSGYAVRSGTSAESWTERDGGPSAQPYVEDGYGAGLAFARSTAHVHGVAFHENGAPTGGAVWSDMLTDLTVSECMFEENYALTGSGVARTWGYGFGPGEIAELDIEALDYDGPMVEPGIFIEKSIFTYNFMANEVLRIDNDPYYYGPYAAIENGSWEYDPATVVNSLFHDNQSGWSVVSAQGTEIWNSTFAYNDMYPYYGIDAADTSAAGRYGAATASIDSSSSVVNGVFWGNTAEEDFDNGEVFAKEMVNGFLVDVLGGFVAYTNTEHGIDAYETGDGNISENPRYFDPYRYDYRLRPGSPSIDTGTNDGAPDDDLLGESRPFDGDADGEAVTDMGAYEYRPLGTIRTGGTDRYDTAVRISRENFDSADVVVIARGDVFADGLTSSGLAGLYAAPVLLTPPGSLPGVVAEEIERLGAEHAIIAGGPVAVSNAVKTQIEGLGLSTERVGGADRYETAELIADEIADVMGDPEVSFIVRGDLFPDALTVSPVAYGMHVPIFLWKPGEGVGVGIMDTLDASKSAYVIGGLDAVPDSAVEALDLTGASVDRITGADRYETAELFSLKAVAEGWAGYDFVGIATGVDFPDALAGGAAVGSWNGVLLLTPSTTLYPGVQEILSDNKASIYKVEIFGGVSAVSAAVMTAIEAALSD